MNKTAAEESSCSRFIIWVRSIRPFAVIIRQAECCFVAYTQENSLLSCFNDHDKVVVFFISLPAQS